MHRTPSPLLRRAVSGLKLGVVSTLALLAVGPVLSATAAADPAPAPGASTAEVSAQSELAALMTQHDCSTTGFGADVIPGSALVQRAGAVLRVGFADGWATYTGDADGTLLAVCRSTL